MNAFLKRLLSRDRLMRMLGRLGVRAFLWRAYCQWFGPGGGILRLDLEVYRARFYVHSQWVFTDLKSFGGERDLLAALITQVKPRDVVYDIGANMGLHAVFLSQAVGEHGLVFAFEPETHYCERLRANVALNGLKNVRIVSLALGDRSYTSDLLSSHRGKAAPRLAEVRPEGGDLEHSQTVRVIAGDELVQKENLPLPQVVKIDVEGHEHAVIRGLARALSSSSCRLVCCEIHPKLLPDGLDPDGVMGLLRSCGFARFDVRQRANEQHVLAFKDNAATPEN
jgi:FkbM family methyltransferase